MTLRVNLSQQSREAYLQKLVDAGIQAEKIENVATAIKLAAPCNVFDLPDLKKVRFRCKTGRPNEQVFYSIAKMA